jgi:hypothetical protein
MIRCAEKLEDPKIYHELVNICDSTPVQALFDGVVRDCLEASENSLSFWQIPFWLFFPFFWIVCMIGLILDFVPFIKNPLADVSFFKSPYLS